MDFFAKGGFLMWPILGCSFLGVAILVNKLVQFARILKEVELPVTEIQKLRPDILEPILAGMEQGLGEKELSIIGTRQIRGIERGLSWLGLIASIAPLLGLTGTVIGMIKAFMVIAASSDVNPSMLAGGIWEALITTAAGLLVAIPMHVGHHYLEKKADEIAFVIYEIAAELWGRKSRGV